MHCSAVLAALAVPPGTATQAVRAAEAACGAGGGHTRTCYPVEGVVIGSEGQHILLLPRPLIASGAGGRASAARRRLLHTITHRRTASCRRTILPCPLLLILLVLLPRVRPLA